MKTYYLDEDGVLRPETFGRKVKNASKEAIKWAKDNWEIVTVIGIPVVGGMVKGIGYVTKQISKHKTINQQQELKDLYIYDRSLGMYCKLRKKLTPSQALEVERRKQSGEKLVSILNDMRMLA